MAVAGNSSRAERAEEVGGDSLAASWSILSRAASAQASPHFLRDIKESISRMAIPEGIVEPG
jgi:hypothetical protein